jgi:hypothetical protein
MATLRVFTSAADLTSGAPQSYVTSGIDETRVELGWHMDNGNTIQVAHDVAVGNETWYHFRWSPEDESNTLNYDTDICYFRDANGDSVGGIEVINGRLRAFSDADTRQVSNQFLWSNGAQYSIDVHVVRNGTTDITVNWYINSAPQTSCVSSNSGNRLNPEVIEFVHFDNNAQGQYVVSEGLIMDEDTRGLRVRELRPQSFGVDVQWLGSVADVVDNDLGTGVSTDVNGNRTSFGVSNLEFVQPGDIVNRVVAQSYAQRGASGLTRFNHYYTFPGDVAKYDEGDIALFEAGDWYITESLVNPKTTLPWVATDLTGIQLGLRAQT